MKLLALTIPGPGGPVNIVAPSGVPIADPDTTAGQVISFGLNFIFFAGIVLALVFLLWGGFSWVISGGEKEKIDKARKTMIYAIVGIIVLVLSLFIIQFIGNLLDFYPLKTLGNPLVAPPSSCPPSNPGCST